MSKENIVLTYFDLISIIYNIILIFIIFALSSIINSFLKNKIKSKYISVFVSFILGFLVSMILTSLRSYHFTNSLYLSWIEIFIDQTKTYIYYGMVLFGRSISNLNKNYPLYEKSALILSQFLNAFSLYISLVIFYLIEVVYPNKKRKETIKMSNGIEFNENVNQKYCPNCGHQLNDQPLYCPNCGYQLGSQPKQIHRPPNINPDQNSSGYNVLAFLIPFVGLILYLIWKDEYPIRAKGIGKWALIGVVTGFILGAIYYFFMLSLLHNLYNYY